jgi:succinate dehydrogenase (ubiquinone) cytochrome b560 subunit
LVQQRLKRPTSPHLGIYKLQISSTLSALNRITGCILSGGFYAFGLAYVAAPLFGWHLESGAMAAVFASWPALVKVGLKFGIAMPFTFHSWNGIRHLIWDTGKNFSNKTVIQTGWLVVGLSVVSAAALAVI